MSDLNVTSAVSLLAYTLLPGGSAAASLQAAATVTNPLQIESEGGTLQNFLAQSTGATYGTALGTIADSLGAETAYSAQQSESSLSLASVLASVSASGVSASNLLTASLAADNTSSSSSFSDAGNAFGYGNAFNATSAGTTATTTYNAAATTTSSIPSIVTYSQTA